MANVDLEEANRKAAQDQLWAIRGHAIQAYASLEQALAILFAHLAGMPPDVSGIIFFRITNARVRNEIITRLLRKRHGVTYMLFWNSLVKIIASMDHERNAIVHWHSSIVIGDGVSGEPSIALRLVPPNFWDSTPETPAITSDELMAFIQKGDIVSRLSTMFFLEISGHLTEAVQKTWHDVFRQEVAYPPPDTHPISRSYKAPQNPPSSSPA